MPGVGERPEETLPPGQYVSGGDWPVLHYGRVPRFDAATWDFRITGATASGREHRFDYAEFGRLPRTESVAALHCVTRFSLPPATWSGVAASTLLSVAPPTPAVTHVMVWATYGYSANLRLADLQAPGVLVASHRDGAPLTPEHGWPYRLVLPHLYGWKGAKWLRALEYLTEDRRGFWEERGYHTRGEVWAEQRYAYQEDVPEPGEPGAP
jgi:DMSO/TMAO reductase YedYZ molybdopterin-dependent catalytic subunit